MNHEKISADVEAIVRKHADKWHTFGELNVQVSESNGTLFVHVSDMYESPPFHSELIFALCDYFGTKKIDSAKFGIGGCDTCDFGSSYGYDLTIRDACLREGEQE